MHWFWNHYLSEPGRRRTTRTPRRCAPQRLAGLPPALVITAEFDPLRDEGEQYAHRLEEAGVPARLSRYDGMIHGFFGMSHMMDKAKAAVQEACANLRLAFSRRLDGRTASRFGGTAARRATHGRHYGSAVSHRHVRRGRARDPALQAHRRCAEARRRGRLPHLRLRDARAGGAHPRPRAAALRARDGQLRRLQPGRESLRRRAAPRRGRPRRRGRDHDGELARLPHGRRRDGQARHASAR